MYSQTNNYRSSVRIVNVSIFPGTNVIDHDFVCANWTQVENVEFNAAYEWCDDSAKT